MAGDSRQVASSRADYFFTNIPIVRAILLTHPAWRPNSAAIFDAPTPWRANLTNSRISWSAHCFGFGVFMVQAPVNRCVSLSALGKFTGGAFGGLWRRWSMSRLYSLRDVIGTS